MTFTHPEYLVSTSWLAEHLDDPAVRVLDVTARLTSSLENRAKTACFDVGHIPGSIFFDVASGRGVLSDPDAPLPWMWPTPEQFASTMADCGIDAETRVVLVARTPRAGIDSGTMWCTRAWWTMHHMGVDCAILHGGIEQWEAEGRPLTTEEPAAGRRAGFTVHDRRAQARATKDDVLAALSSSVCIVDALTADSFDGSGQGYGPRRGHITGAVNVPFRSLIERETAAFVDAETMRAQLDAAGLFDHEAVITYCGGAIAATVDAFCLALFGHEWVSVYDGSLMEWSADPELPMTDPAATR
jgi:thiosulfate/3-mercaptopyruvate sulfurtransferase